MRFLISTSPLKLNDLFESVPTGTDPRTVLQFVSPMNLRIVEWGISVDPSDQPGSVRVELIETDEPATITPLEESGIDRLDEHAMRHQDLANVFVLEANGTGYSATEEGTVTEAARLDMQTVRSGKQHSRKFGEKKEPIVRQGRVARIRVKADRSAFCHCWMILDT